MAEKTKVNQITPMFSTKSDHINHINNKRKLIGDISDCMKLLDKAIEIHKMHIDHPKTATSTSQDELMGLMPGARNCINSQLKL